MSNRKSKDSIHVNFMGKPILYRLLKDALFESGVTTYSWWFKKQMQATIENANEKAQTIQHINRLDYSLDDILEHTGVSVGEFRYMQRSTAIRTRVDKALYDQFKEAINKLGITYAWWLEDRMIETIYEVKEAKRKRQGATKVATPKDPNGPTKLQLERLKAKQELEAKLEKENLKHLIETTWENKLDKDYEGQIYHIHPWLFEEALTRGCRFERPHAFGTYYSNDRRHWYMLYKKDYDYDEMPPNIRCFSNASKFPWKEPVSLRQYLLHGFNNCSFRNYYDWFETYGTCNDFSFVKKQFEYSDWNTLSGLNWTEYGAFRYELRDKWVSRIPGGYYFSEENWKYFRLPDGFEIDKYNGDARVMSTVPDAQKVIYESILLGKMTPHDADELWAKQFDTDPPYHWDVTFGGYTLDGKRISLDHPLSSKYVSSRKFIPCDEHLILELDEAYFMMKDKK